MAFNLSNKLAQAPTLKGKSETCTSESQAITSPLSELTIIQQSL